MKKMCDIFLELRESHPVSYGILSGYLWGLALSIAIPPMAWLAGKWWSLFI